tara:strand:+ start:175 stop:1056 length:882 start_codon:yes stop_codon:yes gene_type:complete
MNTVDKQYQGFLRKLIMYGTEKDDRTGTGTLSYFGDTFRHNMSDGFPLLTTKKMAIKTMTSELRWFLKGKTNIRELLFEGCDIWTGDAYKQYQRACMYELERDELTLDEFRQTIKDDYSFATVWGDLGPIYGKQWRDWNTIDQIASLIENIKENPNSRRLIVSAWNVGEISKMTLPPCHYGFQCYVNDGKLSLMWNQRSVDVFLGLPFNIASYGLLLLLLCEETGYKPGELIGSLGDVHLYKNHLKQAHEQIRREPKKLPKIKLSNIHILEGEFDYEILDYESHPTIKAPLNN